MKCGWCLSKGVAILEGITVVNGQAVCSPHFRLVYESRDQNLFRIQDRERELERDRRMEEAEERISPF